MYAGTFKTWMKDFAESLSQISRFPEKKKLFPPQQYWTDFLDVSGLFGSLQVEEEEMLVAELKKIELRKKEREKKQQELNKLITAAEKKPSVAEHKIMSVG